MSLILTTASRPRGTSIVFRTRPSPVSWIDPSAAIDGVRTYFWRVESSSSARDMARASHHWRATLGAKKMPDSERLAQCLAEKRDVGLGLGEACRDEIDELGPDDLRVL